MLRCTVPRAEVSLESAWTSNAERSVKLCDFKAVVVAPTINQNSVMHTYFYSE